MSRQNRALAACSKRDQPNAFLPQELAVHGTEEGDLQVGISTLEQVRPDVGYRSANEIIRLLQVLNEAKGKCSQSWYERKGSVLQVAAHGATSAASAFPDIGHIIDATAPMH